MVTERVRDARLEYFSLVTKNIFQMNKRNVFRADHRGSKQVKRISKEVRVLNLLVNLYRVFDRLLLNILKK